ncbi:DUF202 domain-containing protein [Williamwhitmania taraxaci]|uniref:Putative membrane protein n=1 Tax=Williamwhitmania taraxaci TaxID=1640674 RepID=A0A1G6P2J5_9BACT|nr:DUF202 domain-containing protein [Williamwhitmania taraxaci]SDC74490.1 putative membrane protein [Williamwhitmania taraxaci]
METEKPILTLNDKLALDRTNLANERTFLAYFRSAVVFLSSGVVILKMSIFEDITSLGIVLLTLSPLVLGYGLFRFVKIRRRIATYYQK